MAKKLFVGGLSWNMKDEDLLQAFAPHGEITEAKVVTDRDTGAVLDANGAALTLGVRGGDGRSGRNSQGARGISAPAGPSAVFAARCA
ncbi:MAG: glycine-rich RNA-binding protein 4, mitochondrial-like [Deltaproteobacteria bacterium]|nr:glycine-rich RNA-binding protein 4, mitochondrial-like [Deltaproteobacteria bacterium]